VGHKCAAVKRLRRRQKYNVLHQILQGLGGLLKVDGAMYWAFIFHKELTVLDLKSIKFIKIKNARNNMVTIVNVGSMRS